MTVRPAFERLRAGLRARVAGERLGSEPVRVTTVPDRWPGLHCLPPPEGRFVLRATVGGAGGFGLSPLVARLEGTLDQLLAQPADTPAGRARLLAVLNAVLAFTGERPPPVLLCETAGADGCSARLRERLAHPPPACPCVCLAAANPCMADALLPENPVLVLSAAGPAGGPVPRVAPVPEAVRRCGVVLVGGTSLTHGEWDRIEPELPPGVRVLAYGADTVGAATILGWEHHCPSAPPPVPGS